MRAFAVQSFGEAPAIHDEPLPAADGAIRIRVTYAGVNPIDYKLLDRLTATSSYPFIMGIDFAAVVEPIARAAGCRRGPTPGSDGGDRRGRQLRRADGTIHGMDEVARMLADGTITARIVATADLDGVGPMLDNLRNGGLRGKVVIRL